LDLSWHRHQVQTLRWKLYETAGKIVFHGRYIYLKVSRSLQRFFAQAHPHVKDDQHNHYVGFRL